METLVLKPEHGPVWGEPWFSAASCYSLGRLRPGDLQVPLIGQHFLPRYFNHLCVSALARHTPLPRSLGLQHNTKDTVV
jgi:hypothetical protein